MTKDLKIFFSAKSFNDSYHNFRFFESLQTSASSSAISRSKIHCFTFKSIKFTNKQRPTPLSYLILAPATFFPPLNQTSFNSRQTSKVDGTLAVRTLRPRDSCLMKQSHRLYSRSVAIRFTVTQWRSYFLRRLITKAQVPHAKKTLMRAVRYTVTENHALKR